MKKLIALIIILIGLLSVNQVSNAQTTNVNLMYGADTTWANTCTMPDTVNFLFYGLATGYSITDSILIEINFGDGISTSFYVQFYPGTTSFNGNLFHIYTLPGLYAVQFIATGPDGVTDTIVDQAVIASAYCGDISGRIYMDNNSDCIYNAGDSPVQGWVTANLNGNYVAAAYSNINGEYFINVPGGYTYDVSVQNDGWMINCPASQSYAVNFLPSVGNDFALTCNPGWDLFGSIGASRFRVNGTTWIGIGVKNHVISCLPPNAIATLTLDPMLSYVNSTQTPVSVTPGQVVFGVTGWLFSVQLATDPAAVIGDTLCLTLTIDPQTGDLNPADNVYTICLPVSNSCDPNEKSEAHASVGTATVLPGTRLDYSIAFQNIGNDVAYDVSVVDELDPDLDLSSLSITGLSHQASIFIVDNKLKFEFNNINLAAASVNEPLSHGFITYSIDHKGGIPNGTSIENTAEIIFDFNAPIITNTVTNIIDLSAGINEFTRSSLEIYPNPANDLVHLRGVEGAGLLTIHDVAGKMYINTIVTENYTLDLSHLVPGVYIVTFEFDGKSQNSRLVVK